MCTSKLATFAAIVLLSTLSIGCSSSNDSPTAPVQVLEVESFSTAIQIEPGGFRIQVRLRVLQGLGALSAASQQGAARVQSCRDGMCAEESLGAFREASCPVMNDQTEIWVGSAWLSGDEIGVDVCVANVAGGVTLETVILDGLSRSNTVQTSCANIGGAFGCGSD